MAGGDWVTETLYPDWGQRFRITRELAHVASPFQDIRIVETASHGRVMLLDGVVQITEADEFAYQEMIAHVRAGDGGVLRRVLAHRTVEAATMVEIDAEVVRLSREHLPGIGGDAWADPRARVLIADGIAHVAEAAPGAYDVIIVDSTDPVGVGEVLFTDAFYADCARLVGPGGIVVNQCGVPFMQGEELRETTLRRARHFADASAYLAAVPTYVGGFMTLGWSAQDAALRRYDAATLAARAQAAGILGTTRYWSPAVHAAAFALPPYIAALLPGG
ncbi:MAG: polyamine aminopropyltransferase [Acetobacteraceae bacterium]|nr:polyamine aminopropyltransferase [Acetobacteraceae bacterium]